MDIYPKRASTGGKIAYAMNETCCIASLGWRQVLVKQVERWEVPERSRRLVTDGPLTTVGASWRLEVQFHVP